MAAEKSLPVQLYGTSSLCFDKDDFMKVGGGGVTLNLIYSVYLDITDLVTIYILGYQFLGLLSLLGYVLYYLGIYRLT